MPPTPRISSDSNHSTTHASGAGPVGPSTDAHHQEHAMDSIDRSNVTGNRLNMTWLCRQFPTLRFALGADPFDADMLNAWVRSGAATGASRHAVRFVLQVWNSREPWTAGAFNVVDAFASWDDHHRATFLVWANDPWFP